MPPKVVHKSQSGTSDLLLPDRRFITQPLWAGFSNTDSLSQQPVLHEPLFQSQATTNLVSNTGSFFPIEPKDPGGPVIKL